MNDFKLNNKSKAGIERMVGLPYNDIVSMNVEDIDRHIERKIKKKLRYVSYIGNLIGRGSILLFFNRLISREEIDKGISRI